MSATRIIIPESASGERLDKVLSGLVDTCSRGRIQTLIEQGLVTLDEELPRIREKVYGGEVVELLIPNNIVLSDEAEAMVLDIIHEDEDCLVLNKPVGLVVHPGAGNMTGTLMNGLLAHSQALASMPRAGIVHRLDKDTSGLMMVAKTEQSRLVLVGQLSQHKVHREYVALVRGRVIAGGTIDEPIARDRNNRIRMAVHPSGKKAITHYSVEERFDRHTLLNVRLETGRTHQIRVHLSHLGWPLVGDRVYAGRKTSVAGISEAMRGHLQQFGRQALHARKLAFKHPVSGSDLTFSCPLADDFQSLLKRLRAAI
ncbi:MAG: RluA family pseudouridine synthase [Arenicellaceae bacterium]|nr:RluA family pseudouridine synthase [Arenicellaceae bacterium]